MSDKIRIYVNNQDIFHAQDLVLSGNNASTCCPIAVALRRKGYNNILVGITKVRINNQLYQINSTGQKLIRSFDNSVFGVVVTKPNHIVLKLDNSK